MADSLALSNLTTFVRSGAPTPALIPGACSRAGTVTKHCKKIAVNDTTYTCITASFMSALNVGLHRKDDLLSLFQAPLSYCLRVHIGATDSGHRAEVETRIGLSAGVR